MNSQLEIAIHVSTVIMDFNVIKNVLGVLLGAKFQGRVMATYAKKDFMAARHVKENAV